MDKVSKKWYEGTEEEAAEYIWGKLSKIDVSGLVEKKQNLSYLSWAKALHEVYSAFPNMRFRILTDPNNGDVPYFDLKNGLEVRTEVTIGPITREMSLPVMDNTNTSLRLEPYSITTKFGEKTIRAADANDINKSKMRCLVKNLALFGLGINVYAGEDLPMDSAEDREAKKELENELKAVKAQIKELGVKNTKGMSADQKSEYYNSVIVSVINSMDFLSCNDISKLNKILENSRGYKKAA